MDAAVEGLVDFRKARLLDGSWWKKLRIVTDGLARRKSHQVLDTSYRFYLAQVANGNLTDESFKKAQESAQDSYHNIVGRIKPWQGKDFKDRKKKEMTSHRQTYIDVFGVDPADPAFQKWEAEEIVRRTAASAARAAAAEAADPTKLIIQRQKEQAVKQAAKRKK